MCYSTSYTGLLIPHGPSAARSMYSATPRVNRTASSTTLSRFAMNYTEGITIEMPNLSKNTFELIFEYRVAGQLSNTHFSSWQGGCVGTFAYTPPTNTLPELPTKAFSGALSFLVDTAFAQTAATANGELIAGKQRLPFHYSAAPFNGSDDHLSIEFVSFFPGTGFNSLLGQIQAQK